MRKVIAYFGGLFLLVFFAGILINQSMLLLCDWLAPVLGSSLYSVAALAFLLFGDPFAFLSLFFIWVSIAFICGMIIRRRLGAVLVVLLIWFSLIPVFGLTLGGMYQNLSAHQGAMPYKPSVDLLELIPPRPSEITLTELIETPILGKALDYAFSILNSLGVNTQDVLWDLFVSLAKDFFLKPFIAVVSVLLGVEAGKLLEKKIDEKGGFTSYLNTFRRSKTSVQFIPKIKSLILISMILAPALTLNVSALTLDSDIYSENLLGFLDKGGNAYVGNLLLDSETPISGIDFNTSGQGLAFAFVASQKSLSNLLGDYGNYLGEYLRFVDLIPTSFAVIAYVNVQIEEAVQRATPIQQYLSTTYNIDLKSLATFSIPFNDFPISRLSLIIYRSTTDIETFTANYLDQFKNRGGFADLIQEAISNGRLLLGSTPKSADGSVFTAGFVNMDSLTPLILTQDIPENLTSLITPFMSGQIQFAGSLSSWIRGIEIIGGNYFINVLDLLGASTTPSFSQQSDFSSLTVISPLGSDVGGSEDIPNVKIVTSVPLTEEELEAIYDFLEKLGYLLRYKPSIVVDPQDFQVEVSEVTLPVNVEFTKTFTSSSGGQETVIKITVKNNDIRPLTDITIDDGSAVSRYALTTSITSGQNHTFWSMITPGETKTFSYTLSLENPGIYTYLPAKLTYQTSNKTFSETSNSIEYYYPRSSPLLIPFEVAALVWGTSANLLNYVTGNNGATIMIVLTLALFALIIYEGYRSYKKHFKISNTSINTEATN